MMESAPDAILDGRRGELSGRGQTASDFIENDSRPFELDKAPFGESYKEITEFNREQDVGVNYGDTRANSSVVQAVFLGLSNHVVEGCVGDGILPVAILEHIDESHSPMGSYFSKRHYT